MEPEHEVRGSVAVLPLKGVVLHEETFPEGEARVSRLLRAAGVFSWPIIVDRASGLVLDGNHRVRVLLKTWGARWVLAQTVVLESPGVRVRTWCRVLEGVSGARFAALSRALGLAEGPGAGFACHYEGRVYGRQGLDPLGAYDLAREVERDLTGNGAVGRSYVDDEEAPRYLEQPETLLVRLQPLPKEAIVARSRRAPFPPKSTRFLLPFRVIGVPLPVEALAGPREAVERIVETTRGGPLRLLGEGVRVDRRYPERLYQFDGYRIPPGLFADPAARADYEAALVRP